MRTLTCLVLIAILCLWTVPFAAASPAPATPGASGLPLTFPSFTKENQSSELVLQISKALGLGALNSSTVRPAGQLYLVDGLGNVLTNRPDAVVSDVVEATMADGATVVLYYTSPGGPDSNFAYATVWTLPINASLLSDPLGSLERISSALGISFDGTETSLQYGLGDQNHTTIFRQDAGKPIEFANQIQLVTYQGQNSTASLWLFPWLMQSPAAAVSEADAAQAALASTNSTYARNNYSLNSSLAQFALDARTYTFAYSFRLWYSGKDFWTNGDMLAVVWVDAATGQVLLTNLSVVVPASPRPGPAIPWTYLALSIVVVGAILAALGYSSIRDETARFALFSVLSSPFFLLRRDSALEHFVRGQIYEYLRVHPGATFTDIRDDLSLKNGSAAHHLMVLERMGFLTSKRDGRLKHFFRNDTPNRLIQHRISPLQFDILDALAHEELIQTELAKHLNVSKQRIGYNVRALRRRGLLALTEGGKHLKTTEAGSALLNPAIPEDPSVAPP